MRLIGSQNDAAGPILRVTDDANSRREGLQNLRQLRPDPFHQGSHVILVNVLSD
jgi:hypothetical protein